MLELYSILLGLVFGSFLHTLAFRWQRRDSLWRRSACDHCAQPIGFVDLIPVLGYLWRRGKCRHCQQKIPLFYPLAELVNGLLVLLIYQRTGLNWEFIYAFLVFETLFLIALLDLSSLLIFPQPIIFGLAVQSVWLGTGFGTGLIDSLLGLFLGTGIFHWIGYAYQLVRRRVGLGEGDAILLGLIGFCFGWASLLPVIFWGALLGIVGGGASLLIRRRSLGREIAFGPWLALAAFLVWRFPIVSQTLPFFPPYGLSIS
jgi:prepilin signal peptidase PulO-like enzyme (type II secretory pathway)